MIERLRRYAAFGLTPRNLAANHLHAALFAVTCALFLVVRPASGQVGYTVIYPSFGATGEPSQPKASLIQGTDGNLYGISGIGGKYGQGAVYKMAPSGAVTVLYSFGSSPSDGADPIGALVEASNGDFYGATDLGGTDGIGTIYKMTPTGTVTILHSFLLAGHDGTYPEAGLVEGSNGYLYGTTEYGGTANYGTVFRMTLSGTLDILHSFDPATNGDGAFPHAAIIEGTDGNFYSTTESGGTGQTGTVFSMTPAGSVTILHSFAPAGEGNDGDDIYGGVVEGPDGYFYGTSALGGATGDGTAFKVNAAKDFVLLHSFGDASVPGDGKTPRCGLVAGLDGNYYGTTTEGGTANDGAIYQLTPTGKVTIEHSFSTPADGETPWAALCRKTNDEFYGVAAFGGAIKHGVAFALIVPIPAPGAPTDLTGTAGAAEVTLAWHTASDATSYDVYRGTSAGGESATPIATGVKATSFTSTGLTNGVTYYYKVAAVNPSGTSGKSNEASGTPHAAPAPPTNLTATAGNGQITLTWTASEFGTSYSIYRGTTSEGESATPIGSTSKTTFTNTGLTNGKTYYYVVKAFNAVGHSENSNQASAIPKQPVDAEPTGLTAAAKISEIDLTWNALPNATRYSIYRGTSSGGEAATPIATVSTTSYADTAVANGTTYYYVVKVDG